MKNRIIKIFVIAIFFSGIGCADLEENPVGLLAPEGFFKTTKDVEAAIFGAYGVIASESLFGRQFASALMLRSDMVDIGNRSTSAERVQVNDFNMDDRNGMVSRFWPVWYQVINAANAAEAGAISLGLSEAEINPYIAEARFIRAFSYYHMVRVFGDLPYIDFAVSNPLALTTISKTSEADIYAGIEADLVFAKQWLPNSFVSDVRSRPTKGTAASYLASVHLTQGNYADAYTEAKWVIDNRATFNYQLEADFQDLFRADKADALKETIFTFDFLGLQNLGSLNDDLMGPMVGVRNTRQLGFGVNVPALAVYTTWNALDYRRKVSFTDSTFLNNGQWVGYLNFPNEKRPHIAKWRRFPGKANVDGRFSDFNYADFRYAEVLLIASEALAESAGVNAEAEGYVNQVRARARNWAGTPTAFPANVATGLSKTDFINLVLEERRLELAFEWKRWYDIKRRKLGDVVFKGPGSLEPRALFDPTRDYLMPLPATELILNPNLAPNNPGY